MSFANRAMLALVVVAAFQTTCICGEIEKRSWVLCDGQFLRYEDSVVAVEYAAGDSVTFLLQPEAIMLVGRYGSATIRPQTFFKQKIEYNERYLDRCRQSKYLTKKLEEYAEYPLQERLEHVYRDLYEAIDRLSSALCEVYESVRPSGIAAASDSCSAMLKRAEFVDESSVHVSFPTSRERGEVRISFLRPGFSYVQYAFPCVEPPSLSERARSSFDTLVRIVGFSIEGGTSFHIDLSHGIESR